MVSILSILPMAYLDPDGDGLTNREEYQRGTNPRLADTDGDGLSDAYEVAQGLNPLNPADAALDPDGDGISNRDEQAAGLNPHQFDNLLAPVFSPTGGVYIGAQTISIANPNPIGRIHYTTDGTLPTAESLVLAVGGTVQTPGNGVFTLKTRVISLTEPPGPVATATYQIRPRGEAPQPVYLGWSGDFSARVVAYSPAAFAGGKYLHLGNGWIVDGAFVPDLASATQAVTYGEVRLPYGGEVFRIGGFTVGTGGLTLDEPLVLTEQGSGRIEAQGQMIPDDASQP